VRIFSSGTSVMRSLSPMPGFIGIRASETMSNLALW
jgi:hypothetical protein